LTYRANRKQFTDKISASEKQGKAPARNGQHQKAILKRKKAQLLASSRVKGNELMHPGVEVKISKETKQISRIYPPHIV
ncbi:DUF342 domain-containing protein, partial [Pseudoalteromonas sp. S186]